MFKNMLIKNDSNIRYRIIIAGMLIAIGSIIRILLHNNLPGAPSIYITLNGITQNMFIFDLFFVVAVISIVSGLLLGGYFTFIVPISTMIISDLFIGNNWILLFTWSGFVMIGLIGYLLKSKKCVTIRKAPAILGASIGGVLLYDIWTNFGTWLGGFGYAYNLNGLALCYTMALPFMFWHLISTTIAISIIVLPIIYIKEHKLIIPDLVTQPLERKISVAAFAILMIATILSIIV